MNEPKQTARDDKTGASNPGVSAVVKFTPKAGSSSPAPLSTVTFTWEALEQQLTELAVTATQRALVPTLVSATRKQASFKPPEMVLREVLCLASVLMDETFHPTAEEGEMT